MSGSEAYRAFLVSSAWITKRKEVFRRDGFRCVVCHARDRPLHAHHLHYGAPWGTEPLEALLSVCSADHARLHSAKS